ncbi:hypothetical protein [Nocardia thraciensis]
MASGVSEDPLRVVALARDGVSPSIAQIAVAAKVSLATAHRHFPNRQSLWADLAWRQLWATRAEFLDHLPEDPEDRVDVVVRTVADMQFADEVVWREVVRAAADRWFAQLDTPESERTPTRATNRLDMAEIALAPLRDEVGLERYERLCHAVAMVFGVEAMITARDTCGLAATEATEAMSWAARSLVRAARADAAAAS